ncbi:MAG TPA: hypothetical protein VE782_08620, partial [Myxococcaceae bacterium]|nr:hypothetical protein [Myxococcaceae bacterium]
TDAQHNRSELLVIVTPLIVQPSDTSLRVPTGEPNTWKWMKGISLPPSAPATPPSAPARPQ